MERAPCFFGERTTCDHAPTGTHAMQRPRSLQEADLKQKDRLSERTLLAEEVRAAVGRGCRPCLCGVNLRSPAVGTGPCECSAATSAPGLGLTPATSAPGLGLPLRVPATEAQAAAAAAAAAVARHGTARLGASRAHVVAAVRERIGSDRC
jgi:hypothetical protein